MNFAGEGHQGSELHPSQPRRDTEPNQSAGRRYQTNGGEVG